MRLSRQFIAGISVAMLMAGGSAVAQQSDLVTVDIKNVANNIAQNLGVDVSQIPLTVQVPVGVAANVCGMDASALTAQARGGGGGGGTCTATNTTSALDQTVQQQIKKP